MDESAENPSTIDEPQSKLDLEVVKQGPHSLLRYLFFLFIIRPLMLIIVGMNVRHGARLPTSGPALVIANHNSHLDALALVALFGMSRLHLVRPVAAADYFLSSPWFAWFSIRILGILPIDREMRSRHRHPLDPISDALSAGQIVLLFPEGTRGEPEKREPFQQGIAHLAKRHPEIPITPVFLHGLGKSLPRGEALLVPFFCDVFVGESLKWTGQRSTFMEHLCSTYDALEEEARVPEFS
jgi:1-acyl-sn-glycerol-3-phosphate acyltransferase